MKMERMWATHGTSSTFVASIRRRMINKAMYSTHQLLIKFKVFQLLVLASSSSPRLAQHTQGLRIGQPDSPATLGGWARPARSAQVCSAQTPPMQPVVASTTLLVLEPPCITSHALDDQLSTRQVKAHRRVVFPNYSVNSATSWIAESNTNTCKFIYVQNKYCSLAIR